MKTPTKKDSDHDTNGIPRFSMPMVLMQSVIVPEYSNAPDQVKPTLPVLSRRVCSKSASSSSKNDNAKVCQLPFQDGDTLLSGYKSPISRRTRSKPPTSTTSAKMKINQNLHAEHRLYFEKLKLERENTFRVKTTAAVIIQRYMRGLVVRMKNNPDKFSSVRASLETHFTKEELTNLVSEAIARAGFALG